jgi:hypothetical protein
MRSLYNDEYMQHAVITFNPYPANVENIVSSK